MELIERIPVDRIAYLKNLKFSQIRPYLRNECKNDEERKQIYNNLQNYCDTLIKTNGECKRIYKYTESLPKSGRLYCGNSLQSIKKEFRGFLVDGFTTDIDMKNAHPTILLYLCKKHNIHCAELEYYCNNREKVLSSFANKDRAKELFLVALNSDTYNTTERNDIFKKFEKECKQIQKQLTVLPEYQEIVSSVPPDRKHNWFGSAINRIMCVYENNILQQLIHVLNENNIEICSLAFDGLLMYGNHYDNNELLNEIEQAVEAAFPTMSMKFAFKNHCDIITMPEDYIKPKTINELVILSDLDAAKTVFKLYPHWVYCKGKLWVYNSDNGLWSCDRSAYRAVFMKYVDSLYLYRPTTDGVQKTTKSYGNDANLMSHLPPLLETMNQDDNWETTVQNSSLGYLLFNNGIYHFETNTFTCVQSGEFNRPDIFFHAKINFDYCYDKGSVSDEMIDYMDDIKQRLFLDPLGNEQGEYFLQLVSRAFAGNKMKKIIFGIGNGNNGKSVIAKAISNAIGLYCGSFNAESLAYRQNSMDEAAVMRWALLARYNRILFSNELKTSAGKPVYLDANMMKKLSSGGDTLVGRGHCQSETEFVPHFLSFVFANDMVEIKPYDNALDNRLNIFHFKKQFVECPSNEDELLANPAVNQEIETLEFKKCMVGILINSYSAFIENGRVDNVPQSVLKAKSDWIPQDVSVIDKFMDTYEFTNNVEDFIFAKDITCWSENCKLAMSTTKIALELKKYAKLQGFDNVCNKDKKVNGKKCVVWTGIRLYQYSDENEEA